MARKRGWEVGTESKNHGQWPASNTQQEEGASRGIVKLVGLTRDLCLLIWLQLPCITSMLMNANPSLPLGTPHSCA